MRGLTALKVMQAIVRSHGKAIVQTATGSLISTYSAFSGSSLSGVSLITIDSQGEIHVKTIKNATLIRMYQKQTIRPIFNSSSQRVVIGNAGVSVKDVRVSNNSLQSVQQIVRRRYQQNADGIGTGNKLAAIGGNVVVASGNPEVVGNYGSTLTLSQNQGVQNVAKERVGESYGGKTKCGTRHSKQSVSRDSNDNGVAAMLVKKVHQHGCHDVMCKISISVIEWHGVALTSNLGQNK